jgi:Zn ribbon nucleic-acid-binding protein
MQVRVYSAGKFYLIECPEGTRVVRHAGESSEPNDLLVVPFEGQEIAIPGDPSELLPLLAESGRCGLSLVGEPLPAVNLAGAVCPSCREDDVSWLSVDDGSNCVHCDNCGCDFGLDAHPLGTSEPTSSDKMLVRGLDDRLIGGGKSSVDRD